MPKVDIKQEAYFPYTFRIFGLILLAFGVLVWTQHELHDLVKWLVTIGSWALGLSMASARYGLWVDPEIRKFCVYVNILGWKSGKPINYEHIESIFINEVTESATVQSRAGSVYDFNKKVHKAFMKLDDGEKIHMDTDKKAERLKERVESYRQALGVTG